MRQNLFGVQRVAKALFIAEIERFSFNPYSGYSMLGQSLREVLCENSSPAACGLRC